MVIVILIILLIVWVALVGALYSSFLMFYGTFGDTLEYNKAYYGAVSGLERAQLVLRYRSPWFEWSGGWMWNGDIGINVDHIPSNFSVFTGDTTGILWNISSRATTIPASWEGNVEWMLATGDSLDYNMLDYVNAENFSFEMDNKTGSPYIKTPGKTKGAQSFIVRLRLPSVLFTDYEFGKLQEEWIDVGNDGISDDAVVDWSFRGNYNSAPFQVLPTTSVRYSLPREVLYDRDSIFRESRINTLTNTNSYLTFWNTHSPFSPHSSTPYLSGITVISSQESVISGWAFNKLLTDSTDLIFRTSLLNLLYSEKQNVYPYLEYQLSFFGGSNGNGTPTQISDRFYTIDARGKFGSYEVKLLVKKPTIKESILGSFTVIF